MARKEVTTRRPAIRKQVNLESWELAKENFMFRWLEEQDPESSWPTEQDLESWAELWVLEAGKAEPWICLDTPCSQKAQACPPGHPLLTQEAWVCPSGHLMLSLEAVACVHQDTPRKDRRWELVLLDHPWGENRRLGPTGEILSLEQTGGKARRQWQRQ